METSVKEQHEHCWHESGTTYTSFPAQHEQVCCHCGARKRMRQELVTPEGHGPHAPKVARWVIDANDWKASDYAQPEGDGTSVRWVVTDLRVGELHAD